MGCWNETCVLTRLPIPAGSPVVALNTVYGPRYKSREGAALKTDLLFGLPFEGTYDDYGGVENLTNPELHALHEAAFLNSGFFRKVELTLEYGAKESWLLAAHPDTLWSLTDCIKPTYYSELCIRPSDVSSYDEPAREKTTQAFMRAEAALAQLGKRLKDATFSASQAEALDQLFSIFEDVFGKDRAWAAYSAIQKEGLFASRGNLLMHQSAYQALVTEFGNRMVGYYQEKTRTKLRDFIAKQLDSWLEGFPAEYQKFERLFGEQHAGLSAFEQRKRILRYAAPARDYGQLKPLTTLWMAPELPLVGHFWGGAMPEEIVAVTPRDVLIDYFVFQWARFYLRLDFTKPDSGSQNQEVVLPATIFKATLKALRADGRYQKDFYGRVHR